MPKQLTKTLGDFNVSTDILRQGFVSLAGNKPELNDLGIIFEVGLTDLSLFPNIKLSNSATYMDYLEKWIKGYADATANPPSRRKASPKGSCSDPAIQTIVQIAMNADETFLADAMSIWISTSFQLLCPDTNFVNPEICAFKLSNCSIVLELTRA